MMPAMSLATRCTACGTIFRVVQDQLRVSEGWVRCGRCAEVFDARQQLFDIERESPPPWPAAPAVPQHAPVRQDEHEHRVEAAHVQEEQSVEHFELPEERHAHAVDEPTMPLQADTSNAELRDEPRWVEEATVPPPPVEVTAPASLTVPADLGPDVVLSPSLTPKKKTKLKAETKSASRVAEKVADSAPIPSFVRQAQAQERWRRPGVRFALAAASVLLLLVLGTQFALYSRDALAAQYPASRSVLGALCEVAGCEIQPWRHIEVLSVENTGLVQAGTGNQYQLSVSLLNKGNVAVALPWIELSLTDSQGTLLSRRTLSPQEFRTDKGAAVGTSIAGGADLNLQLLLDTGDQRVSGYGVVLFYP